MTADARIDQLRKMRREALRGGGPERIAARRRIGEKTARERLNELLDPGTFVELDKFFAPRQVESAAGCAGGLGEGVVTGYGRVAGRDVYVFSRGASIVGDAPDDSSMRKIIKVMDLALKNGAPLIGLNGAGGGGVPGDGMAHRLRMDGLKSSSATSWPLAWCRRSRPSWEHALAGTPFPPR